MEYVIYTDSELEQARSLYFEKQRLGKEQEVTLSKELFCRLIRNTMTNMIAIARASEENRYPTKHEVISMAKRLTEYYPMIKDKSSDKVWVCIIFCQYKQGYNEVIWHVPILMMRYSRDGVSSVLCVCR